MVLFLGSIDITNNCFFHGGNLINFMELRAVSNHILCYRNRKWLISDNYAVNFIACKINLPWSDITQYDYGDDFHSGSIRKKQLRVYETDKIRLQGKRHIRL